MRTYPACWRIVARKLGADVIHCRLPNADAARTAFDGLRASSAGLEFDNIELQFRGVGEHRFRPIVQAIGDKLIQWGTT